MKRAILIGGILLLAMPAFSMLSGRPGDLEAGLIGGVLALLFCLPVVVVELVTRRLARSRPRKDLPEDAAEGPHPR
jgi:hypothetical protein